MAAVGEATVRHFNVMMDHLSFSEDTLLLEVDMIQLAQVAPNDESVRILANQLILKAVERAMHSFPAISTAMLLTLSSKRVLKLLSKTSKGWRVSPNKRGSLLQRIGIRKDILNGEVLLKRLRLLQYFRNQESQDGFANLDRFYNILKNNNAVETSHFNYVVLQGAKNCSDDIRHAIDVEMPLLGIFPTHIPSLVGPKTTLEGDRDTAKMEGKFIQSTRWLK